MEALDLGLLGFAAVVVLGYTVQTVTGFGSTLVCITLGALFMDLRMIVTLTVPISLLQTGYIVARHRRDVRGRLLARRILPLMAVGLAIGFVSADELASGHLRRVFGVMVLVLAVRELWRQHRGAEVAAVPPAVSAAAMIGAGFVHGLFATGGPLLVYALGRSPLDKRELRATLSAVWLVLNVALLVGFSLDGRYGAGVAGSFAWLLPAIPLGVMAGEALHRGVDERRFRTALFALLAVAAVALIARP